MAQEKLCIRLFPRLSGGNLVSRIKICAAEEQIRKNVSGAQAEFIRHCRIRNLSLRTIDYYQEDIEYFLKWSNLKFVDDITKDVMDNFVAH